MHTHTHTEEQDSTKEVEKEGGWNDDEGGHEISKSRDECEE